MYIADSVTPKEPYFECLRLPVFFWVIRIQDELQAACVGEFGFCLNLHPVAVETHCNFGCCVAAIFDDKNNLVALRDIARHFVAQEAQ